MFVRIAWLLFCALIVHVSTAIRSGEKSVADALEAVKEAAKTEGATKADVTTKNATEEAGMLENANTVWKAEETTKAEAGAPPEDLHPHMGQAAKLKVDLYYGGNGEPKKAGDWWIKHSYGVGAVGLVAEDPTQACARDSDLCLEQSPNWGSGVTCSASTPWCESWPRDMHRCCPESCEVSPVCDLASCNLLTGQGSCTYPNPALVQDYPVRVTWKDGFTTEVGRNLVSIPKDLVDFSKPFKRILLQETGHVSVRGITLPQATAGIVDDDENCNSKTKFCVMPEMYFIELLATNQLWFGPPYTNDGCDKLSSREHRKQKHWNGLNPQRADAATQLIEGGWLCKYYHWRRKGNTNSSEYECVQKKVPRYGLDYQECFPITVACFKPMRDGFNTGTRADCKDIEGDPTDEAQGLKRQAEVQNLIDQENDFEQGD